MGTELDSGLGAGQTGLCNPIGVTRTATEVRHG